MRQLENDLPDLIIVDITLPDRSGLDLIKDIRALHPALPVIVLTMHEESLYALRSLKAGARGYLRKDASHTDYEKAFRRVLAGGVYVSETFSEEIMLAYATGNSVRPSGPVGAAAGLNNLTDRELEVFELFGQGKSTHQVADTLHISPKTVHVHTMKIREKLGLEDGSAVVRQAIRLFEARRLGLS
jgi:DNA-binding NarL/FixJ family response regulator